MTSLPPRPLDKPLVFAPFFRPQIWGGRRLETVLNKPLPAGVSVGESWELSAQDLHISRVAEGPWAGVSLKQLWGERRQELMGDDPAPQFPWLIKWLDCQELLSVQVHPDDATAQRMLGEPFGKTESWVVLHAEPTAKIFAGLKPGVTREELERRARDGTVAECLHEFVPQAGDCLHIPAGTVHAVGGGVVMAEVQQTSDATFRLFDWNRVDSQGKPRELHLDQALESIDFQRGPVQPVLSQQLSASDGAAIERLVQCPYFQLDRVTLSKTWQLQPNSLCVAMVLSGTVTLTTVGDEYRRQFHAGETVLIPARASQLRWTAVEAGPAVLLWVSR